jgi:hypothetical protein
VKKLLLVVLTVLGVKSISPLTDEGGGAAGDDDLRSKENSSKLAAMLIGAGSDGLA